MIDKSQQVVSELRLPGGIQKSENGEPLGKLGSDEVSQKSVLSIPSAFSRRDEHGGIFRD